MRTAAVLAVLAAAGWGLAQGPALVAHRGLLRHAPENTRAAFAACLELRLGFELDVRRSKDGVLVCVHDDNVARTTNGKGRVADLTLAELKKLDAGTWFDPVFAGERVPTLDEVLALLARHRGEALVALDIKIDDGRVEADLVKLVREHGVMGRVVCIGTAIDRPTVRRRLRAADARIPVAVLAANAASLPAALGDRDADWVYLRFLPAPAQVKAVHEARKKVFLVGPLVAGKEPENWRRAKEAGVDAVLTDYPLDCRAVWRSPK